MELQQDLNPRPRSNISAAWNYFKRYGGLKLLKWSSFENALKILYSSLLLILYCFTSIVIIDTEIFKLKQSILESVIVGVCLYVLWIPYCVSVSLHVFVFMSVIIFISFFMCMHLFNHNRPCQRKLKTTKAFYHCILLNTFIFCHFLLVFSYVKCQKKICIFFRFRTFCIFLSFLKKSPFLVADCGLTPPPVYGQVRNFFSRLP